MKRILKISDISKECTKLFGQEKGVTYDVVIPFIGFHYRMTNGKEDPNNSFDIMTEGSDFYDGTHPDGRIYLAIEYEDNVYRIFFDLTCNEKIRNKEAKPEDYMYPYEQIRMTMPIEGSSVPRMYLAYILRHNKEENHEY